MDGSALDAAAGEPHGEAEGVVVSAVRALGHGGATELAAPNDERLVEQAPRLEVFEQPGDRLVGVAGVASMAALESGVLVPAVGTGVGRTEQFDEADATLDESAGDQAFAAEWLGHLFVESVQLSGGLRLVGEVGQIGNRGLHAESEFVVGDGRFERAVGAGSFEDALIESAQQIELGPLRARGGAGDAEVGDRFGAVAEQRTLITCG